METKRMSLTGNEAAAWAIRNARVSVNTSFPMGPNQEVLETLQKFVDNGEITNVSVIIPDNEKSAASLQIGAARIGARSMHCVNSEGILWAASEIHYAASSRLPMLMICPSRALEPPTTVYCDHDDFLALRDMGWLMFYCEDSQDIYDTILQTYKIMEQDQVMLPAIVGYDGWETSHAAARVDIPDQEAIDAFLPAPDFIKPEKDYLAVDWKERASGRRNQQGVGGPLFMDIRHKQKEAQAESAAIIEAVGEEYKKTFNSRHTGMIESHECEDAELVVVTMGIVYPSVKFMVNALRLKGIKIGCVKLRAFRPFPAKQIIEVVENAKLVVTLDRNSITAIFSELGGALYSLLNQNKKPPMLMGKTIGVGGSPITLDLITGIIEEGFENIKQGKVDKEMEWVLQEGMTVKNFLGEEYDPTRHTIWE
jgi:pyruvate/2-oxoacid:ferredoxin oxidoreductase alpha subunit